MYVLYGFFLIYYHPGKLAADFYRAFLTTAGTNYPAQAISMNSTNLRFILAISVAFKSIENGNPSTRFAKSLVTDNAALGAFAKAGSR